MEGNTGSGRGGPGTVGGAGPVAAMAGADTIGTGVVVTPGMIRAGLVESARKAAAPNFVQGLWPPREPNLKKPGVWTDVLDTIVGELPPENAADDGGTDGLEASNLLIDTDALQPTDPLGVFSPTLRPRDNCYLWGDPNNPDFSLLPGEPDVMLNVATNQAVPPVDLHPFPNAVTKPNRVTIKVTQYDKDAGPTQHPGVSGFDVHIFRYDGIEIGSRTEVDTSTGEGVVVWSAIPFAVYVWSDMNGNLNFKYGENGVTWGSDDKDHQCTLSTWNNGERNAQCILYY